MSRLLAAALCALAGHDWRRVYRLADSCPLDWCARCGALREHGR